MNLEHAMKRVMATVFAFYVKAHGFHFNVEGPHFHSYHKFLDDLYNDVWESFDAVAEQIRALDVHAPGSMQRMLELSAIEECENLLPADRMIQTLLEDNEIVMETYADAYQLAGSHLGLQNFLQDRIDAHAKWAWQLKAMTIGSNQ